MSRRSRPDLLIATIVLLFAALPRLYFPLISEFKLDEAMLSRLALDMATGQSFPLTGITTSAGFPNAPISVYLYAIPYFFDHTPYLATITIALVNLLAVALTYRLVGRHYGRRAAIIAALLYAAAPWALLYTRRLWANFWLPPFVLASMLTLLAGYKSGKHSAQIAHWPLLALTAQIHFSGAFLIPASLLAVVLFRRRIDWRSTLSGVGLAIVCCLPFAVGLVQQTPTLGALGIAASPPVETGLPFEALNHAWLITSGQQIHSLAGPEAFQAYLASVPPVFGVFGVLPVLLIVSVGYVIGGMIFKRGASPHTPQGELSSLTPYRVDLILLTWLIVPMLALSVLNLRGTPVYPHYLIAWLPAPFIVIARGLDAALGWRPARGVGWAMLGALATVQVGVTLALFDFVDTHATPGTFGMPLHYLLDTRAEILSIRPSDVIVVAGRETLEQDAEVWEVLLYDVPRVRAIDGTQAVVYPAGRTRTLITSDDVLSFWHIEPGTETAHRPGERGYTLSTSAQVDAEPPYFGLQEAAVFANGVSIIGHDVLHPRPTVSLMLPPPQPANYGISLQSFDANGGRLTQEDRNLWDSRYWREGDRLDVFFATSIPAEAESVTISIYILEPTGTVTLVDVIDALGNPAAPWLEITLP